ncbi:M20/M25/M40 family metallo-hydrolase [Acetobacter fallax]|uniref:M20/M25/M40 family metallo-hydrolase n=1 Tax=Acetobacter fallax TaxID=1737473 RepID=A0ABX0K5Q9_9PROT|nr:M20/M25/M40 family metallo-hydrolase [Acetobacter fallax]NHO31720.1 M20/M25/M40 family metallo-hydrolase [Acetobacter fallax]NHO35279.1 M20/M25/M40 family metallo-hydrolase [Acetobacter fallax]
MRKALILLALTALTPPLVAKADTAQHPQAEEQALTLAEKAIALRSVAGPGNQTPQVAALFRSTLIAGGFQAKDITITPFGDTAYMTARWPGSDPSLKPVVISGHMDVVEAKPADWQRDPFKPVVENGYLFGRGATDMKLDAALVIASLIELKREGYTPRRDIILALSGDEETAMETGKILADKLSNADLVLNGDVGVGILDEKTGKPDYYSWEGAEKTYADFRMTVTNPGGHSSEPRADNAIDRLAAALLRIQKYQFRPELNALSKSYFTSAAQFQPAKIATAMRNFAANPASQSAIATLSADPALIGKIGTTCVVTMINGGHALNALPQSATANINCRIFPGHPRSAIMAELEKAAADPDVHFSDVTQGSVETEASPMRPDFTQAVEKAMHGIHPGLPVFPGMTSGASDSMWFRNHHVPSYSISPVFLKPSENFSHGLNERTPVAAIGPAIDFYLSLLPDLSH